MPYSGRIDSVTPASTRSPTVNSAVVVGVICAPVVLFSSSDDPAARPRCAASPAEITDWFAPVSMTNGKGPRPFTLTGAVSRRHRSNTALSVAGGS